MFVVDIYALGEITLGKEFVYSFQLGGLASIRIITFILTNGVG
jgi:hypothetical protein